MATLQLLFILTSTYSVLNAEVVSLDAIEDDLVQKYVKSNDLIEIGKFSVKEKLEPTDPRNLSDDDEVQNKTLVKERLGTRNHSYLSNDGEIHNTKLVNVQFKPELEEVTNRRNEVTNDTITLKDELRNDNFTLRDIELPIIANNSNELTSETNSSTLTAFNNLPGDTTYFFDKSKGYLFDILNNIYENDIVTNKKTRDAARFFDFSKQTQFSSAESRNRVTEKNNPEDELPENQKIITVPNKNKDPQTDKNMPLKEGFNFISKSKDQSVTLESIDFQTAKTSTAKAKQSTTHKIKKVISSVWKKMKNFVGGVWNKVWKTKTSNSSDTHDINHNNDVIY